MTHCEKVLALLSDGEAHSHRELYSLHVIAHSRVAELRKQGHVIECWRDGDLSMYRLVGVPGEEAPKDGAVSLDAPVLGALTDVPASSPGLPPTETAAVQLSILEAA